MTRYYLDLHALQSLPPSNVNRDETGSPKTATFGGVVRARVSSQSWKRAIRLHFNDVLDESQVGIRSKRLVSSIASRITALAPDLEDQADDLAAGVLTAMSIKVEKPARGKKSDPDEAEGVAETSYLIFLSNLQIENLADYAVRVHREGGKPVKREVSSIADRDHSFDIALFGRMVADVSDLRVDATAQVAHAISVHAVENEFDYFTAVDDHENSDHAGAGMIGTVEFNSSTLYRYATVNVSQLVEHLGDTTAAQRAITAFVDAFVRSMPTGKQNTFANRTLPSAVLATLRPDQPVNLCGAFETPVVDTPRLAAACEALAVHAGQLDEAFGRPDGTRSWVVTASPDAAPLEALGEKTDLASLSAAVAVAAAGVA